jgi:hypothetical protein
VPHGTISVYLGSQDPRFWTLHQKSCNRPRPLLVNKFFITLHHEGNMDHWVQQLQKCSLVTQVPCIPLRASLLSSVMLLGWKHWCRPIPHPLKQITRNITHLLTFP